jgi:arginine:pyruvate transaminase
MQFSSLVRRVAGKGAEAWRIHFAALEQRAAGRDVILLTVGDPDQAPPEPVLAATIAALKAHDTGYSPILGLDELRAAIAQRIARRTGVPCTGANVAIVPGTQAGLFASLLCLAGAGDEVIAFEPTYATYEAVAGASGATLVTVPLRPERGFHPDLDALARAVTHRTRVLWVNSPHNPTGAVLTADELEAIAALCRQHDLWLLSDEVYEDLAFARPHISPRSLPGMTERTVVVSSLSKSHAVPGFRAGWVVAAVPLIKHLFNLMLCMTYGGPSFTQRGALAALEQELPDVAHLREDYRRRGAMLAATLAAAPHCRVIPPEGGMFVLLDVRGTRLTSEEFAEALLHEEDVAVLPCDGFGPSGVGHLRISLAAPDERLAEAGRRILHFAGRLTNRAPDAAERAG